MQYTTLNNISISKKSLISNYQYFQKSTTSSIAPVIKSNAYGHGLIQTARFIDQEIKPPFVCVDSLYEAYELYKNSINTPILILGYTHPSNYSVWKKLPFHFAAWDLETLRMLNKYQKGSSVHIKIDSGMNRLGIKPNDVSHIIEVLKTLKDINIVGIFSHLSSADTKGKETFTKKQVNLFKNIAYEFEREGFSFQWKHISATAGLSTNLAKDKYFNLSRLGLGFYGYTPFQPHTKESRVHKKYLTPALKLSSKIAVIKNIEKNEYVSYGGTYKSKQKEKIAILPLGYNEGIPYKLSNKGFVQVNKTSCPIIGKVAMNMTTIKLTRFTNANIGDSVTIIDSDINSDSSIYSISNTTNTKPYTILVGLNSTIRRELV